MQYLNRVYILLFIVSSFIHSQTFGQTKTDTLTKKSTDLTYVLSHKPDSLFFNNVDEISALLGSVDFISATIYFSGKNFNLVAGSSIKGKGLKSLSSFLSRCVPGTTITIEKAVFKKPDGSKSFPFSKAFIIK